MVDVWAFAKAAVYGAVSGTVTFGLAGIDWLFFGPLVDGEVETVVQVLDTSRPGPRKRVGLVVQLNFYGSILTHGQIQPGMLRVTKSIESVEPCIRSAGPSAVSVVEGSSTVSAVEGSSTSLAVSVSIACIPPAVAVSLKQDTQPAGSEVRCDDGIVNHPECSFRLHPAKQTLRYVPEFGEDIFAEIPSWAWVHDAFHK